MKKYNSNNYNIYKKDVRASQPEGLFWDEYTRDELIIKFMPLVENLARKFSTSQQATSVLTLPDLIQEGNIALIKAVDKIDWKTVNESKNSEKTLKSFFSKRIKGAIRRAIDNNRGTMRIPEHRLNEIRRSFDKDENAVNSFFNSIFTSIEDLGSKEIVYEVPEQENEFNNEEISDLLVFLIEENLNEKERSVICMSYGIECDKLSASEIADKLNISGTSSYVRVSQLKRQAINKLKQAVSHSQVTDYL